LGLGSLGVLPRRHPYTRAAHRPRLLQLLVRNRRAPPAQRPLLRRTLWRLRGGGEERVALRRGERAQARLGESVKCVPHSRGDPPHGFRALPHTFRWPVLAIARIDDSHGGQAHALWAIWKWPDCDAEGPGTPPPGGRAPAPSRRSPPLGCFALCERLDDCSCYFGLLCSGGLLAEGTRVPHYTVPNTAWKPTRFFARHRRFENLRNGFESSQNKSSQVKSSRFENLRNGFELKFTVRSDRFHSFRS
jgi:hypothetical protein